MNENKEMVRLIYISSATKWPTEDDLKELLEQAREKNAALNITGMLAYDNATFMQILEGEKEAVDMVFEAIKKDSRNTGVVLLDYEEIDQRSFPGWSMGFRELRSCRPDELPGYVDIFNSTLSKETVEKNKSAAINLILNFAR